MADVLDTLLSTASNLVTSGFNGFLGRRRLKREFKHQEKMLNMQNEFTEKMWNMQNEYNDPSAQMDRLTAAGINPIDAASEVSGNAGNSASVSSSTAPSVPQISDVPVFQGDLFDSYAKGKLFRSQLDALDLANKNAREDWINKQMENAWKPIEKYFQSEQWRADLKNAMANYNLTSKQVEELTYNIDNILPETKRISKAQADNMEATAKLTLGQVDKNNQEIENLKKERDEMQARIANYNQSTDLLAAQTEDVNADKLLKQDLHKINEIDKRIKELEEDNAKLTNRFKHDLDDAGHNPDLLSNPNSPTSIAHYEAVRRSVSKVRDMKEKAKYVDNWNKKHPTQLMRVNSNGEVEFIKPKRYTPPIKKRKYIDHKTYVPDYLRKDK